jgi:hypothetical protein
MRSYLVSIFVFFPISGMGLFLYGDPDSEADLMCWVDPDLTYLPTSLQNIVDKKRGKLYA